MNEPTLNTLTQRLDRLERENGRARSRCSSIRISSGIVLAPVGAASERDPADYLKRVDSGCGHGLLGEWPRLSSSDEVVIKLERLELT